MSATVERYLDAMGIDVFRLRTDDVEHEGQVESAGVEVAGWEELADRVSGCTLCDLHKNRTRTVFGVGRRDADLMVIGEAPGADEDRQGEPFVGRAGQLLNAMLRAIGLAREDVFIANILKCRPPNNRDPSPGETACCTPYLERQIELIAPRAVLAVGRIAAQHLLQSDQAIGRLRGQALSFGSRQIPIVATYHPAYLLRSPLAKSKAWQDLVLVRRLITERQ
jgi:DNA polymerase